jgi:hypothetical protein
MLFLQKIVPEKLLKVNDLLNDEDRSLFFEDI